MKVRNTSKGDSKIDIQMTPMIDIVFQLLTFFIMTFKVVVPEGDFNIKMPLAAPSSGPPDESLALQVKLRITADPGSGDMTGMKMNDQNVTTFEDLHRRLLGLVGTDSGPNSLAAGTEVELDCDYDLRYEYVIRAISEVTGYVDRRNNKVVKLIEKIKFAPQRKPG